MAWATDCAAGEQGMQICEALRCVHWCDYLHCTSSSKAHSHSSTRQQSVPGASGLEESTFSLGGQDRHCTKRQARCKAGQQRAPRRRLLRARLLSTAYHEALARWPSSAHAGSGLIL